MIARTLFALAAISGSACAAEVPSSPPPTQNAPLRPLTPMAKTSELRVHTDALAAIRFPIARTFTIEARHYDETLPLVKFRHSIDLAGPSGEKLLIHVWSNPERIPLAKWFEANLAFMVDEGVTVSERVMTPKKVPGLFIVVPRSPQAVSQAVAVFAIDDRVYRVTGLEYEDESHRALFDKIVDEIEPVSK